jgi:hypothetical protein
MKALGLSTTTLPDTTSSHSLSTTSLQTTFTSSILTTTISDAPTSTEVFGDGDIPGGNGDEAQPTAASEADSGGDTLSPQEKQIVGGVVGSVAGVAFFLLIILMALRHRKRKQSRALGEEHGGSGARGITGGDHTGGGGGGMTERSVPAAVTAALASLTGKRQPPASEPPPTGERGFYRVSGRKLPSVLQSGGDGYTDPHESIASGTSDYYRGSQAFDPASGANTRLALGSPMRPVSGVPIMRDGPGRTPVHESNPFADPPSPPAAPDPVGRSHPSQDGSGASGSRFRERI